MAWKKGESGNPNGAKPGVSRNRTAYKRELIEKIVESILKAEGAVDELMNLEDKGKKWDILAKLLPYYVPRLESEQPGSDVPVRTLTKIEEKLRESGAA